MIRKFFTIAVVDDDEAIADAAKLVLEGHGWRVRTFARGEEFLEALDRDEFDCLILDPHLQGMSGAEVAQEILESQVDIPIIALTARVNSPVTDGVIDAGARVVLSKPVRASELVKQVRKALHARKKGEWPRERA